MHESILIRGARVHNLKNIVLHDSAQLPHRHHRRERFGKSSLAFDTIYAEGQRSYVESLSAYARQFLERMDKPDVDAIEGIGPAMAIEQKTNIRNPRSTVGTTTEIYDYLRSSLPRIGTTFCRQCGKPVTRDSVATVRAALERAFGDATARGEDLSPGLRYHVSFPLPLHPKETLSQAIQNLQKEGFIRVVVGDRVIDTTTESLPPRTKGAEVAVLVDRLLFRPGEENERLADAVETAFAAGSGKATVTLLGNGMLLRFDQSFACAECHIAYQEPDPRLFSFNNPFGACPECQGFGRAVGIDLEKVVPDPGRTIREGAIAAMDHREVQGAPPRPVARAPGMRGCVVTSPSAGSHRRRLQILFDGYGEFGGINAFFAMLEKKTYKIYYRVLLSRYRGIHHLSDVQGSPLADRSARREDRGRSIAEPSP